MSEKSKVFEWPVRVYYEDTDAGGIVYYANYLKYAERSRTEWLRSIGLESSKIEAEQGIFFVVKACNVTYHRPAQLDDSLICTTEVEKIGGASISLKQDVFKENQLYVSMQVTLVLIDKKMRPVRIDNELKEQFLK